MLARYALGEITDDAELQALEDHLIECDPCRRRAVAVDLIGSSSAEGTTKVLLHVGTDSDKGPVALCGENSPHVISRALLSGLDATIVCPYCRAALQKQDGESRQFVN
jgi:hypothetical protein